MRIYSKFLVLVFWLLLCIVAAAFVSRIVEAQSPTVGYACGSWEDLTAQLHGKYGESLRMAGITNDKPAMLLQIWTTPTCSTWTAIIVTADKMACITAAGTHLQGCAPPGEPL